MKQLFSQIAVISVAAVFVITVFLLPAAASGVSPLTAEPASPIVVSGASSASSGRSETTSGAASSEISASSAESRPGSSPQEASSSSQQEYTSKKQSDVSTSSTNDKLKSLYVSYHTLLPGFDPDVQTYGVLVANDVTHIYIHATPANSSATVTISGNYRSLDVGINVITITVTAPSGNARHYYVRAKRQSTKDGVIDSAALSAYLNGLESNTAASAAGSSITSAGSGTAPASKAMPLGMRVLIAVAVVSGVVVAATLYLVILRKRRIAAIRRKKQRNP